MVSSTSTCPIPLIGESQPDFAIRAHAALKGQIPTTSERNRIVLSLWRQHGDHTLAQKAREHFPDDRFEHRTDIPVFAEHTKERTLRDSQGEVQVGPDGKPATQVEKYDLPALRAICDRCNHRIEDTGNFAALSKGHTPVLDQLDKGAEHPDLLGFVGPFYLGMIGDKTPRWAIFADEHYFRDAAPLVSRLPTRSVEVWLAPNMGDRFFDPIAALGTETPRLDMGVRFSRLSTGELVERYSAEAPGVGSVSVPNLAGRKDKYSETVEEPQMAMSPEDIQAVVAAVMQTKPFQFLAQLMESQEQEDMNDPAQGGNPAGGMGEDPGGFGGSPEPDLPGDAAAGAAPPSVPAAPPADVDDPNKDKNARSMYGREGERERYARIERENRELRGRVAQIEHRSRKAERYSKLSDLRREFALDVSKELARCEKMTDSQFLDHVCCIRENYSRIPVGLDIPVPVGASIEEFRDKEQYSRRTSERARDLVMQARESGQNLSFEAALDQAKKEFKK